MKSIIIGIAIVTLALPACNNNQNKTQNSNQDTLQTNNTATNKIADIKNSSPINDIIAGYLQLKDALANDKGNDAASAGKAIVESMIKIDTSLMTMPQKKIYTELADDVKENAEHIGANADKIAHQREHFEMLSKDIYDLVKVFGGMQTLYQDYCPMYNNGKGVTWISQFKEIKNPYLGNKMPTCGVVKDTLK